MKYHWMAVALLTVSAGAASDDTSAPKVAAAVAAKVSSVSVGAQLAGALRLLEQGEYRDAVKELKRISKAHDKNPEVWRLLGVAAFGKGDYLGSKIAFEKSLKIEPDSTKTLGSQAELFLGIGDRKSARSNLDKLEKICPKGCDARELVEAALDLR